MEMIVERRQVCSGEQRKQEMTVVPTQAYSTAPLPVERGWGMPKLGVLEVTEMVDPS